jgi:hypothetical protein
VRLLIALLVVLMGCPTPDESVEPPTPAPEIVDAGDVAFARRASLLVLGRRPSSGTESEVFARIASVDRAELVRAMSRSEDYRARWAPWLRDTLAVNRTGFRAKHLCYDLTTRDAPDGSLTRALRTAATPGQPVSTTPWTMADLTVDALVEDDLGPLMRANILAQLMDHGQLPNLSEATSVRRDVANVFVATYLGRNLDCTPCHNSDASVTGHDDPELDRTWEFPGRPEAALFESPEGQPLDRLSVLFRMAGVVQGWSFGTDVADGYSLARVDGCEVGFDRGSCGGCPCEEEVCAIDPSCCNSTWHEGCAALCQDSGEACRSPWPDDFDGCQPVVGSPGEGCGGCSCQPQVCTENPECCSGEWTLDCASLCADVGGCDPDTVPPYPRPPWGMHPICGPLLPQDAILPDVTGEDGYLGGSLGADGSVYDIEALLADGLDALAGTSPAVDDVDMTGPEAFAWLASLAMVDAVWAEAFGSKLTLPHGFARNRDQQERHGALARTFTRTEYSLVEVLVAVTADPLFNAAEPDEAAAYPLPPVFEPFSVEEEEPSARGNGLGDQLHRVDARVQLRAAQAALGWPARPEFFLLEIEPEASFQASVGLFLQDNAPGFDSVGFQALLSWESATAACAGVAVGSSAPGCSASPDPGCDGCGCDVETVCSVLPSCCEDAWDESCALACRHLNGCPLDQSIAVADRVDELIAAGPTWEEGVSTLKDWLVCDPSLDDEEERAAWETLLGAELTSGPADEQGLRAACGALLSSPEFLMVGLPMRGPTAGAMELSGDTFDAVCARVSQELFDGALDCAADDLGLGG